MPKWVMDPATDSSPIISSRIRLARNVAAYPFQTMLNDDQAKQMMTEVADACTLANSAIPLLENPEFVILSDVPALERQVMLEQHMISHSLYKGEKYAGLVKHDDDSVSVMLNEEDHVRIQGIGPGDNIDDVWRVADRVDDAIEARIAYAFDKGFGYLTACPTNTGTGLRASFMVHLPMLDKSGQLKNVLPALGKFGMTVRGIYGEGTEPLGSIFQISNQLTLGKSEEEIIEALKSVTKQVIDNEYRLLDKALSKDRMAIEDNVYRSYGVLSNARKISSKEAISLLSNVRLGFMTGLLDMVKPSQPLYSIMMNCQPGSLEMRRGVPLEEAERDVYRAEYLRHILAELQ